MSQQNTFSESRYENMPYNRVGKSGLKLPAISLGMWHYFGENDSQSKQFELLKAAFDHGITQFDLADNYGGGFAEKNIGKFLKNEFKAYRDELIISTKAGHQMGVGPYSKGGTRKRIGSGIDACLGRLQLEYVDIFYHHFPDSECPLEETAAALADVVRQGKALYIGISNYYGERCARILELLEAEKVPCLINQLPFNMLDRNAAESGEFDRLEAAGVGSITFSPLAQGMLSNKYLNGIPEDSRAATEGTCLESDRITPELVKKLQALNSIAEARGQSLAQMALTWNLSFPSVASVLIGASKPSQIVDCVEALQNTNFSEAELNAIDVIIRN